MEQSEKFAFSLIKRMENHEYVLSTMAKYYYSLIALLLLL
jgi:hypothetical protein